MALHASTRKNPSPFLAVGGNGMKYLSRIAEMIHGTEDSNGRPIVNEIKYYDPISTNPAFELHTFSVRVPVSDSKFEFRASLCNFYQTSKVISATRTCL
jgi:hypothetical protein